MKVHRLRMVAVSVAVCAGVAGWTPSATAGGSSGPAVRWQPASGAVGFAQQASVVELTDRHGQRSAAAVAGLQSQAPTPGRGALPGPAGPPDATGSAALYSAPILTGPFHVAGLSWDRDTDLAPGTEIHLRVREDGVWSDWLDTPGEQAPDTGGRQGTAPFVTGGADAVQVHVTGNPADLPASLRLNVIQGGAVADVAGSRTTSFAPVVTRSAAVESSAEAAVLAQPAIVDRAGWGANESLRNGFVAATAELRATVVHHTAGTNSYTANQSPQIVRDIYYLHTVTNGWGDVGYNFLVDKFGTVFEGRYGSIASPDGQMRVGAHAQGYNTYSMGVAAMGDYSNITADQRILDRMRDLIAWRYSSTPTLDMAAPALFPANDYHTTDRYLPRIFGHRDVLATVCPGNDIHGRIPDLITAVTAVLDGAAPPEPNTTPVANAGADRTARAGSAVTLAGTGTDADNDPLSYLWTQTGGTPTVTLANAGTPTASFVAPALPAGTKSLSLTFTLRVTDDRGATGTDTVVVKVVKR